LLGLALLSTKGYSENRCNDASSNKNCVQIFVESSTGQALKDLVVYLEPLEGQKLGHKSEPLVINQEGRAFDPYISVSQVDSNVNFVNKDDITHHIYSAGSENKFSFKIKSGETNASVEFTQPAEVAMGCNIHDWMSGYLLIVDTPIFGKTDKKGQLNLTVQHSGEYKLVVWHPQLDVLDNRFYQQVQLSEDKTITVKLDNKILKISEQKNEEDFDFLSDY
jgi:plastocyanin